MGLNIFQRRRILKGANYLELTPVRSQAFETSEDGIVILLVPKFKSKKLSKFLIPASKSDHFRIHFDALGTAIWLAIDGKTTVGTLCNTLSVEFGEKIQPAEERITRFLTMLYEQRYITFKELLDAENNRGKYLITNNKRINKPFEG